jgi:hypothetical protein
MNAAQRVMVEELCRSYVSAKERRDLNALLANFTNCETAKSPISGKQSVPDFYTYVMRVTSDRSMELKTVFVAASEPLWVAIHIAYTRRVGDGKPATVDGVDIFELTEDTNKFAKVTIIYDTVPMRAGYNELMNSRN